jgi:hypothetical protein
MKPTEPHADPPDQIFETTEELYRSIGVEAVYTQNGSEYVSELAVKLPACSFNRSKYSKTQEAIDLEARPSETGVASISVGDIPTPILPNYEGGKIHELYITHAPVAENYSHTELRIRRQGHDDPKTYKPNSPIFRKFVRDKIAEKMRVRITPT